ncbi:EthD domain-containing protein [Caballeronia sp. 15711]|uniref:EthD domain-containing protein n=1 Tax=Caballeronia sp. 15711 TaxID=3391029 RepID=UPI0039E45AEA
MNQPDFSARDKVVKHNVYASVRRRDGLPQEAFSNYWRDVHSTLCSRLPGLNFYVQQHFDRDHYANSWPLANGVRRIEADRLNLAIAEIAFASPLAAKSLFSSPTFKEVLGEQARYIDAMGVYLVTGFYTFVRDGRPTLAGLRGSRPAELTTTLGAVNQLDEKVTAKFAPR